MFKGFDFIKKLLYGFRIRFSEFPVPLHPEYQPPGCGQNTGCGRQVRLEHPFHGREAGQGGWGLHEKDTFRRGNYGGKLYFFRSVGEQPDKFRLFLYGGNLYFSVGSLILWIASGLSRTAASCACSGNRLFSFGMVVSFYVIFRIQ